jgi:hypothetical protein
MLGSSSIYCKSSKQKLNGKSSTESELIAVSDALPNIIWCYNFLEAQQGDIPAVIMYQDNTATIELIERGRPIGEATRHINIRYFFIHHYISSSIIDLWYCPTAEMIADFFTKAVPQALHDVFSAEILGEEYDD